MAGISSYGAAFLVSKFLISFAITPLSTCIKEDSAGFLKYCFILEILGCLLNFFIVRTSESGPSPVSQKMLSSILVFNVFTMLPKNDLKVSAVFASSVKTLPPSTNVILLFLDPFFPAKSADTVSQNNLLSVILLRFKFSKYFFFFFVVNTLHDVCAVYLMQDLTMIVWLSFLSIKFFWLALMYLFLTGPCLPNKQRNFK